MADELVQVLVAPLPPAGDAGADGGCCCSWDEPFDVLLHWRLERTVGACGRVVRLERSLRDFSELAASLRAASGEQQAAFHWETFATDGNNSLRPPGARRSRLRFALEAFVAESVAAPLSEVHALALQRFFAPTAVRPGRISAALRTNHAQYTDEVDQVLTTAAAASGAPLPSLGTPDASVAASLHPSAQTPRLLLGDEWVPAGCSFEREVVIDVEEGESGVLVVWRFVSQRQQTTFAVHFSPSEGASSSCDDDTSDPYSAAYQLETDDASDTSVAAKWEAVRLKAVMDFPEDLDSSSSSFAYGHWACTKPGVLRFTWENADMNCVLSKQLQFQIAVAPLTEQAERLDAMENHWVTTGPNGESLASKMSQVLLSTAKSVSDGNLPDWCGVDEDPAGDGDESSVDGDAFGPEKAGRLQQRELFEDTPQTLRLNQLEATVAELERALSSTKQELREARDQTEIATEIYKAGLETISRLEHEVTVGKRVVDAAEPAPGDDAPSSVSTEQGVDEGEHERVKSLCASFQEQCLWRSIETAESEKRNLQLEARLNDALNEKTAALEQLDATKRELEAAQDETSKLRAHRSVLAQEVKRLQPYSQVNLTALVQEAQEARMMQRSLQTQLDLLRASGGTSLGDSGKGTTGDGDAGDCDGADVDFVVVSSSLAGERVTE